MNSYEMVKGFSPMIREVIRTDRMPPYNADPHVGKFADDKNLIARPRSRPWSTGSRPARRAARATTRWAQVKHVAAEWPLGKPDLVARTCRPTRSRPRAWSTTSDPCVANPLTEGKWMPRLDHKAGTRQGVHHLLTGWMTEVPADGRGVGTSGAARSAAMRWARKRAVAPKNVGTYLPPGGAIGFQTHYTPVRQGSASTRPRSALYFYKREKPE